MDALLRMKGYTNARIGVGCVGPRLNTQTMLAMRADHAKARDSVFTDVSPQLTERLGLMTVQSQCDCKDTYVTRPDLGRKLSDEAVEKTAAIASEMTYLQLSTYPNYKESFTAACFIPHTDKTLFPSVQQE